MKTYSTEQMKQIEKNANAMGVSYLTLMQNAGRACAEQMAADHYLKEKSVVILCGNGNNGGDGFVIARHLAEKEAAVTVILAQGPPKSATAKETFSGLETVTGIELFDMQKENRGALFQLVQADYIIDCVFGTGFHGTFNETVSELMDYANQTRAVKIAVDIPSGMQGDNGTVCENTFLADTTYILGAFKNACPVKTARRYFGEQILLQIGIPEQAFLDTDFTLSVLELDDMLARLPKRRENSHKGDYGRLLILAGSPGMGGAAMMCTMAAMRAGAGITVLASAETVTASCSPHMMEAMTLALPYHDSEGYAAGAFDLLEPELRKADAVVVGCGLGTLPGTAHLVRQVLAACHSRLILDADGINALGDDINIIQAVDAETVLTPHPGEFSRLTGKPVPDIEANRPQAAYRFVKQVPSVLVLKGHETLVASPDGTIRRNTTGCPALAKGGSGDVLSGMLGAFAAQGFPIEEAACLAVCYHGACGQRCASKRSAYGVLARDIIEEIPVLLCEAENYA